jgi:hypothetical protein
MSRETNNEIDLLLRRLGSRDNPARDLARPDDTIARSVEASAGDRHLDTDELSSYAQNALPAAARARYTEHLAECATCRRLVTELSVSVGAATAPVAAAHEPSGWKSFLAGLFSPFVLRYAVPALGVIVVLVVGFVVLRQRGQQEFVAQLREGQTTAPAAAPSSQSAVADSRVDQQKQAGEISESSTGKPGETRQKAGVATEAASNGATADAPVTKDQRAIDEVKPAVAATPTPAAPAKGAETAQEPAKTDAVAKKQEEQPKEKAADEVAKAPTPGSTSGFYTVEPATRGAQSAPKNERSNTTIFGGSRAGVATARPSSAKRAEEDKRDDAGRADADTQYVGNEAKTIAGRRFRKQGGIWTDTAYDSSTATVNMARNSEQFRALVADEPAIGTIARQLEGEVIVVWKGRAYHIR